MRDSVQTCRPGHVQLVALGSQLELKAQLQLAAARDRHQVIAPTHVVMKDGAVLGYGSLGAVPMFLAWMDTRRATARDSFTAWQLAEADLAARGHGWVCMACEAASPFAPYLTKRGYTVAGTAQLCLKDLTRTKG